MHLPSSPSELEIPPPPSPHQAKTAGPDPAAQILRALPHAVAVLDGEGNITQTNPAWEKHFPGQEANALAGFICGQNYLDELNKQATHNPDCALIYQGITSVLHGERQDFNFEYQSGHHWYLLHAQLLDTSASAANCLVLHENISGCKASEQYASTNDELAERIIACAPNGILVANQSGFITRANQCCHDIFGYDNQELVGAPVELLVPDIHREEHGHYRQQYLDNPSVRQMVHKQKHRHIQGRRKNGSLLPVEISLSPVVQGGESLIIAMISDISQKIRTEKALIENQKQLEKIQAIAQVGTWRYDFKADRIHGSPQFFRSFNLPANASPPLKELAKSICSEDYELTYWSWQAFLQSGTLDCTCRILINREIRWMRIQAKLEYDKQQQPRHALGLISDVSDLRRAELQTQEERDRAQTYLEVVEVFLVALDQQARIQLINRKACEVLGYREEELLGQPWDNYCTPELRVGWKLLFPKLMSGQENLNTLCEYPIRTARGDERIINFRRYVIRNREGVPIGMISSGLDVTEERLAQQALAEYKEQLEEKVEERTRQLDTARREAEQLARVKSDFLANMSHEIRTPLNAILGLAQVGLRENFSRKTQRLFNQMLDSGQLLLGIINEILDFSKIDAGKLRIEAEAVNLKRLQEHLQTLSEGPALEKGIQLSIHCADNLPEWISCDFLRLTQILGNLLSNAIKFTTSGEVCVRIERSGEQLLASVTDTGIGMSEEQISRLFNPFEQADSSTTRNFGGTGLGLAISRRLSQLMGGNIHVQSELGKGSTFTLSLPLEALSAGAVEAIARGQVPVHRRNRAPEANRLTNIKILAAEDNPVNQVVLTEMLGLEGAKLTCCNDGFEALSRFKQAPADYWDIVLTDIQMPRMDGYTLARQILKLAPGMPIIGLTAHAMQEEKDRCMANGMRAHVSKPVDLEYLVATIQAHAKKSQGEACAAPGGSVEVAPKTPSDPKTTPPPAPGIDFTALLQRFNQRSEFVQKIIKTAYEANSDLPDRLRRTTEQSDFPTLALIAHTLKGTAGSLQAAALQELSARTETAARQQQAECAQLGQQLADMLDQILTQMQAYLTEANSISVVA